MRAAQEDNSGSRRNASFGGVSHVHLMNLMTLKSLTYSKIVRLITLLFLFSISTAVAIGYRPLPNIQIPEIPRIAQQASVAADYAVGKPARLVIPAIDLDAKVQHVGIAKSGNMGIPNNFKDAGWYKLGPKPGEPGSAVMSGHVDNALGLAGVFKNLNKLSVGDDLYVKDEVGREIHFRVTEKKTYSYTDKNTEDIFAKSNESHLNLITCTGRWVKKAKTYDTRLVVFTERVE